MEEYVLHWRYSDGSNSGVLPMKFSKSEREMIGSVLTVLQTDKEWEFVLISKSVQDRFMDLLQ